MPRTPQTFRRMIEERLQSERTRLDEIDARAATLVAERAERLAVVAAFQSLLGPAGRRLPPRNARTPAAALSPSPAARDEKLAAALAGVSTQRERNAAILGWCGRRGARGAEIVDLAAAHGLSLTVSQTSSMLSRQVREREVVTDGSGRYWLASQAPPPSPSSSPAPRRRQGQRRAAALAAPPRLDDRISSLRRDFARRLRAAIEAKGWSPDQVETTGFDPALRTALPYYLSGRRFPRDLQLRALAKALGVVVASLLPPGSEGGEALRRHKGARPAPAAAADRAGPEARPAPPVASEAAASPPDGP